METMKNRELTVYCDIKDVENLQEIRGFVPKSEYGVLDRVNPYEFGCVRIGDTIIKFRVSGAISSLINLFHS
jgi:hypothetical protein